MKKFDATREDIVVVGALAVVFCWIFIATPLLFYHGS